MSVELAKKNVKALRDLVTKYNADIKPWKAKYEDYKEKRKKAYQLSNSGKYLELSKRKKEIKQRIQQLETELHKLSAELITIGRELGQEKVMITRASESLTEARKVLSNLPELLKMQLSIERMGRAVDDNLKDLQKLSTTDRANKDAYAKAIVAIEAEYHKALAEEVPIFELYEKFSKEKDKFDEPLEDLWKMAERFES